MLFVDVRTQRSSICWMLIKGHRSNDDRRQCNGIKQIDCRFGCLANFSQIHRSINKQNESFFPCNGILFGADETNKFGVTAAVAFTFCMKMLHSTNKMSWCTEYRWMIWLVGVCDWTTWWLKMLKTYLIMYPWYYQIENDSFFMLTIINHGVWLCFSILPYLSAYKRIPQKSTLAHCYSNAGIIIWRSRIFLTLAFHFELFAKRVWWFLH